MYVLTTFIHSIVLETIPNISTYRHAENFRHTSIMLKALINSILNVD